MTKFVARHARFDCLDSTRYLGIRNEFHIPSQFTVYDRYVMRDGVMVHDTVHVPGAAGFFLVPVRCKTVLQYMRIPFADCTGYWYDLLTRMLEVRTYAHETCRRHSALEYHMGNRMCNFALCAHPVVRTLLTQDPTPDSCGNHNFPHFFIVVYHRLHFLAKPNHGIDLPRNRKNDSCVEESLRSSSRMQQGFCCCIGPFVAILHFPDTNLQ